MASIETPTLAAVSANDAAERCLDALELTSLPCEYADIRLEATATTRIVCAQGEFVSVSEVPSLGAFLRVYQRGRWFYRATTDLTGLAEAFAELIEEAQAWPTPGALPQVDWQRLAPWQADQPLAAPTVRAHAVPLAAKRALCAAVMAEIAGLPGLASYELTYQDAHRTRHFASSRGTRLRLELQRFAHRVSYVLKDGDRRFNEAARHHANTFEELAGLPGRIAAEIRESHAFLDAPLLPPGAYRMVLAPGVVGVFAHESFGHKSEADLQLGDARALAEWQIGRQVASKALSIVDDGGLAATGGYLPWDDEGVPAGKTYLIKAGILTGRLHSHTTAAALDEAPTGNARALDFEFEPIVRMTNTYVEAGTLTFEQLVGQVEDGIYVKSVLGGSGLSTFTLNAGKCYRIRAGRIEEPVRVNMITGSVFETLVNVEACANDFCIESTAIAGCGKFEQVPLPVAYGGPTMLVSSLNVS